MIEKLDRRTIKRVFTPGTLVSVVTVGVQAEARGPRVAALFEAWMDRTCRVTMRRSNQIPLPQEGGQIEILSARLDGIYRLPAQVEGLNIRWSPADECDRCDLGARPDLGRAVRQQDRRFYRLTGDWPAMVSMTEGEPGGYGDRSFLARVHSLSADGFLLDDPADALSEGLRFRASLDLGDGGGPLDLAAEVVRRDAWAGARTGRWGCRLLDPARDQETRILRHLNDRIWARLGGPRPRDGSDILARTPSTNRL